MTTPQWTDDLDDLLLVVAGTYNSWSVRVHKFNGALNARRGSSRQEFTAAAMYSRFQELCRTVPPEPADAYILRWSASQTHLLTSIDKNTRGESMEAKTILFNRAAKHHCWKVATLDQVELKLKQLTRNAAKSSPQQELTTPDGEVGNESQPGEKRTLRMRRSELDAKRRKSGDDVATEKMKRLRDIANDSAAESCESDLENDGKTEVARCEEEMKTGEIMGPQTNGIAVYVRSLLNNQLHSDVTFLVEGTQIFAHRTICARYSKFHTFFSEQRKDIIWQNIEITDVSRKTFLTMMEYVYTDCVDVSEVDVLELYVAASRYGIDSLKAVCSQSLMGSMGIEDVAEKLLVAAEHDDESLRDKCLSYILRYPNAVSETHAFMEMARSNPELMVWVAQKMASLILVV